MDWPIGRGAEEKVRRSGLRPNAYVTATNYGDGLATLDYGGQPRLIGPGGVFIFLAFCAV